MRDIYSHSRTTLVCLSTTFAAKRNHEHGESQTHNSNGLTWFKNIRQNPPGSTSLVDLLWKTCFEEDGKFWPDSFLDFLLAPWWERSWVYQEFVSSPDVHFVFEDEDGPWEEIFAYIPRDINAWTNAWSYHAKQPLLDIAGAKPDELVNKKQEEDNPAGGEHHQNSLHPPLDPRVEGEKSAQRLGNLFSGPYVQTLMRKVIAMLNGRSHQDSQVGDLRILLCDARHFRASDARDKVYAFVGLAQSDYGFQPDYSSENTAVHVHSDAARRIIEHDQDLTYILEQAFSGRGDLGFFLPSWVPDWNCREDRSVLLELEQYMEKFKDDGSISLFRGTTVNGAFKSIPNFEVDQKDKSHLWVSGKYINTLGQKWTPISRNLRQFTLGRGVSAYAPLTARPGDEIWALVGCKWLTVLRREESTSFCFGGFAVISGLDNENSTSTRSKIVLI